MFGSCEAGCLHRCCRPKVNDLQAFWTLAVMLSASKFPSRPAAVAAHQKAQKPAPGLYNVSCAAMAEMLPFALRAGLPMPAFVDAVTSGTGQRLGLAFASGLKALGTDVLCGHGIDEQVCVCVFVCAYVYMQSKLLPDFELQPCPRSFGFNQWAPLVLQRSLVDTASIRSLCYVT